MENEINFCVIFSHAHVKDLPLVTEVINRLIPNSSARHLFRGLQLGSILPNFILALEGAHRLVPADKASHDVGAHVDDDLLWDADGAPRRWIELSSIEMVREHEDMLVSLLPLPLEVLAELTDAGVDAVHSTPAWVAVELQLPPRRVLVDVVSVQLAQVEGEPVEDEEEVGVRSSAKAGNVLVVRNEIASFGHTEGLWANSTISLSAWWLIARFDLILPMMAGAVPGVADPHDCEEAGLTWLLLRLESVCFRLERVVCGNDLGFSSIIHNRDVAESKGRLQEVLRVEAVLVGVLPWQFLAIVLDAIVNEEQPHLVRSNVMSVEEVHRLDRVGRRHFEAGIAPLHLV